MLKLKPIILKLRSTILQQKRSFRSILTVFGFKLSKTKAVFFLMNSFCGLKANGPQFQAKMNHLETEMKYFEAKMNILKNESF